MLDRTVLFTAGQGGYAAHRIPCIALARFDRAWVEAGL